MEEYVEERNNRINNVKIKGRIMRNQGLKMHNFGKSEKPDHTRDYGKKSGKVNERIARSNAISLAVKNIEMAIATDYDNLYSFNDVSNVDNIEYRVNVNVEKYSDKDFSKEDIVKIINVNVDYMFNGKNYEYELKTLKGKVL